MAYRQEFVTMSNRSFLVTAQFATGLISRARRKRY